MFRKKETEFQYAPGIEKIIEDIQGGGTIARAELKGIIDELPPLVIVGKDSNGLYQMFSSSRDYRNSFDNTSSGPIKKEFALYCDIVDETGAIATIATILSMNGISIKNIGILHNREFDEGVLKIDFYDEEALKAASEQLRKRNYIIYER